MLPSPALVIPLPVNRLYNKLAPKVHKIILRSPHLCSFASILIVSLAIFINKTRFFKRLYYDTIHFFIRNY